MALLTDGDKCVKYLLFIFNFIFWLAGMAVLAIGLWLRFDAKTKGLFEGESPPTVFFTGVYILIGTGVLMMVVGFLGCCGAISESKCMLGFFFFFLLIIFAIAVAAGIWGFKNKEKIVIDVVEFYSSTFNTYIETKQEALKVTLRLIQHGLKCCGTTGPIFDGAQDICPKTKGLNVLITKNCPMAILELFYSKLNVIGGVGIAIAVIMIFGMVFSMMLFCSMGKTQPGQNANPVVIVFNK